MMAMPNWTEYPPEDYYSPSEVRESESGTETMSDIDTEFYLACFYPDSEAADWYRQNEQDQRDHEYDMSVLALAWNQR